jgi:Domain of unknown function (DUF397)
MAKRDGVFRPADDCAGGSCVEVAFPASGGVLVRDSKQPDAGVLGFSDPEWRSFLASVQSGKFDLPGG